MAKYIVSDLADGEEAEIFLYLVSNHAKTAAVRLKAKFKAEYERLAEFPLSGAPVKTKCLKQFRFSIVEKYYIFYTFKDSIVTIERVLHTARNVKTILKKEKP